MHIAREKSPFNQALPLHENDYPCIPIKPGEKSPGTYNNGRWEGMKNWTDFTKRHPTIIELSRWMKWPDAGVGVLLGGVSGIVALDYDEASPEQAVAITAALGPSPVMKRGARGFTAFYRHSGEASQVWRRDGSTIVELLSTGRQTVLPPSIHPTGIRYEWMTEATLLNTRAEVLPALPSDFAERVAKVLGLPQPSTTSPNEGVVAVPRRSDFIGEEAPLELIEQALSVVPSDDRDTWIRVGMALWSAYPGTDGMAAWSRWSAKSPKFDLDEIPQAWRSFSKTRSLTLGTLFHIAREHGYSGPTRFYQEFDITPLLEASEPLSQEGHPDPSTEKKKAQRPAQGSSQPRLTMALPEAILLGAPGLVGDIARWVNDRSLYPHPALSLAAALAFVGCLKGHRVQTPTGLRTNLYVVGVAPSGAGKNFAIERISDLASRSGLDSLLGGRPASHTGLVKSLADNGGRRLVIWDELGLALKELTNPNAAGYKTAILRVMMELFSKASGRYLGDEYANSDNRTPRVDITQPCLSVYGASTPERFFQSLSSDHAVDGFLARWLVFETGEYFPERRMGAGLSHIPAELVEKCRDIQLWPVNDGSDGDILAIEPRVVPFSDEAAPLMDRAVERFDGLRRDEYYSGGSMSAFWGRAWEHAAKVALTVSDGREVGEEAARWSLDLVTALGEGAARMVEREVASNQVEAEVKRVLGIIARAGEAGLTTSDITRRCQFITTQRRRDILQTLVDSGQVEVVTTVTSGRPLSLYRAVF